MSEETMLPGIPGQPKLQIEILGAFAVLHQAIVELFKLTGVKSRRYWEALAYIVSGPNLSPFDVFGAPAMRAAP